MPPTTPNSSVCPDGETLVSVADHRGKHALRLALAAMHRPIGVALLARDHVVAEEDPQLPRIASLTDEALHIVLPASPSGRITNAPDAFIGIPLARGPENQKSRFEKRL